MTSMVPSILWDCESYVIMEHTWVNMIMVMITHQFVTLLTLVESFSFIFSETLPPSSTPVATVKIVWYLLLQIF